MSVRAVFVKVLSFSCTCSSCDNDLISPPRQNANYTCDHLYAVNKVFSGPLNGFVCFAVSVWHKSYAMSWLVSDAAERELGNLRYPLWARSENRWGE